MSYNGSGTFNINSAGQPVVTGTVIASTPFNALTADLGTGLSTAITKDGQTTTTSRIPFAQGINSSLVTDATNTATGSIITAGGVGIAKALFVGTTANIAGATTLAGVTATSITDSGTLAVTGATTLSSTLAVTGITTVAAGSAALPAIVSTTGTADTGLWFPAADTVAASTAGAERLRIDNSGNVGIGTASVLGSTKLEVYGSSAGAHVGIRANNAAADGYGTVWVSNNGSNDGLIRGGATASAFTGQLAVNTSTAIPITFYTNNAERMRIDSGGAVFIGCTAAPSASVEGRRLELGSGATTSSSGSSTAAYSHWTFINGNGAVGSIQTNASATSYNTSSDYRLKTTITPMVGALAKVAALKPVTYKWKVDGSDGQGFIAHELQEVVAGCVTGEKDATREEEYEVTPAVPAVVDAEGVETTPAVQAVKATRTVPSYQGIDTSFLVATLTAAIQELKAIIDTQATRIAALEAK